jgi:hypothetical protein|tara:strand:+ start:341 stop:580 length:240 start_codon:yes stop_codon:yes gene_type:complete
MRRLERKNREEGLALIKDAEIIDQQGRQLVEIDLVSRPVVPVYPAIKLGFVILVSDPRIESALRSLLTGWYPDTKLPPG